MKIHFIAIGGSAMHNLALALHDLGHQVTGSDDEIYDPSRSRLDKAGLLPEAYGWYPEKINDELDIIILGMHARQDNPELARAQELGLKVYSYPEYVAEVCKDKKRVVVAGSHGKTTTTSIIMNALEYAGMSFDYLVGAQLEGYDRMVKLSDAPIVILEGDEYLSSPIDLRPKMLHYHPHLAVITGIAWDHINVFPTQESYDEQFDLFVKSMEEDGKVYYYGKDDVLHTICNNNDGVNTIAYDQILLNEDHQVKIDDKLYDIKLIGSHNLQNINAAALICQELGLTKATFYESLAGFSGAARRLQLLKEGDTGQGYVYLDFAHAPSKVRATVRAVKETYPETHLNAILELHTFSSLNKNFLPTYAHTMDAADKAFVYYDQHTLKMKRMEDLDIDFVKQCFGGNVQVLNHREQLQELMKMMDTQSSNLLLMSSGKFGGINIDEYI